MVVIGSSYDAAGYSDILVRTHDAKSGTILWRNRIDIGEVDFPSKVVMDDQRVVVTGSGHSVSGTESRMAIRTYAAKTGAVIWTDTISGPFSIGVAMNATRVIVGGAPSDIVGGEPLLVRAYVAKTGAIAWEDRSAPPPGLQGGVVQPRGITIHGDTAYVAAGVFSPNFHTGACLVRAYRIATGTLLWQSTAEMSGRCFPFAIAADGRNVVVSGQGGIGEAEFAAVGFDAENGALLWRDRSFMGTPFTSAAVAVAIDRRQIIATG